MTVIGQVTVMKDSQPWAVSVGESIQVKQVIVTGADGYAKFQVSDGSTFEVFPNSTLTFRNNPGNWRDLLDVWIGRVKVHIEHLSGQPNPNKVTTPTAVISVRGTTFDVTVEDNDDTTLVVVEEGQVAVQHALLPRGEPKLVNPGEYLRVYRDQPLADNSVVDKGALFQKIIRAMNDALYTVMTQGSRLPGAKTPGPTMPGDTGASPPPAPPPPPPPQ